MTSLSDLIDLTRNKIHIDPNGKQFDDNLITTALTQGITDIQSRSRYALPQNKEVETGLVMTGQETVLPADFVAISDPLAIKWGESTLLDVIDYNEVLQMQSDGSISGSPQYAYIRYDGTNFVIGVFPVDTSKTLTVPYLKSAGGVASGSPLPTDYDEPLTSYAVYYCLRNIRSFKDKADEWYGAYLDNMKRTSAIRLTADRNALRYSQRRRTNKRWN